MFDIYKSSQTIDQPIVVNQPVSHFSVILLKLPLRHTKPNQFIKLVKLHLMLHKPVALVP